MKDKPTFHTFYIPVISQRLMIAIELELSFLVRRIDENIRALSTIDAILELGVITTECRIRYYTGR